MSRNQKVISLQNIYFSYGNKKILNGITFSVPPGEILALIGVSGSGKTTLFKLISGLIEQDSGEVICSKKEATTYMQQEDLLLPWRNLIDNILLFSELGHRHSKGFFKERAVALLKRVGLEHAADLYPEQLSGGMKQRATLARALLQDRPLLLLDEPFGSLDLLIREELYKLLLEIRTQYNKTMILVTHDFRDALSIADRILILQKGKIKESFKIDGNERENPLFCNKLCQQIKSSLSGTPSSYSLNEDEQRAALI